MTEAQVATLWAEHEISAVLHRYCRGVDRMDADLVRSCYHADATDEHGSFTGTVDEYLEWSFRLLAKYEWTTHVIGDPFVEVSGAVARAETYGIAYHRTPAEPFDPTRNFVIGFRFVDRFEQRDGAWRIAQRVGVSEWVRVDAQEHQWPIPTSMRTGARDRSDAIYSIVPEIPIV